MSSHEVIRYWSRLLVSFSLVVSAGCGAEVAEALPEKEVSRATGVTITGQGLSSIPPIHDPELCTLPSGRYVVSAAVTNTLNVYNVTFHNDGVEAPPLSANCRTMRLVWSEGIPWPSVPPQPPAEADFPKRLLEGWWQDNLTPKQFAVKAVWATNDNLGVITQIAGVQARGYFGKFTDQPDAWRFNWTGLGSDQNHTKYLYWFGNNEADRELYITDEQNVTYQFLTCISGTTRLPEGYAQNCPLPYQL